jgi:hypothetical protein
MERFSDIHLSLTDANPFAPVGMRAETANQAALRGYTRALAGRRAR